MALLEGRELLQRERVDPADLGERALGGAQPLLLLLADVRDGLAHDVVVGSRLAPALRGGSRRSGRSGAARTPPRGRRGRCRARRPRAVCSCSSRSDCWARATSSRCATSVSSASSRGQAVHVAAQGTQRRRPARCAGGLGGLPLPRPRSAARPRAPPGPGRRRSGPPRPGAPAARGPARAARRARGPRARPARRARRDCARPASAARPLLARCAGPAAPRSPRARAAVAGRRGGRARRARRRSRRRTPRAPPRRSRGARPARRARPGRLASDSAPPRAPLDAGRPRRGPRVRPRRGGPAARRPRRAPRRTRAAGRASRRTPPARLGEPVGRGRDELELRRARRGPRRRRARPSPRRARPAGAARSARPPTRRAARSPEQVAGAGHGDDVRVARHQGAGRRQVVHHDDASRAARRPPAGRSRGTARGRWPAGRPAGTPSAAVPRTAGRRRRRGRPGRRRRAQPAQRVHRGVDDVDGDGVRGGAERGRDRVLVARPRRRAAPRPSRAMPARCSAASSAPAPSLRSRLSSSASMRAATVARSRSAVRRPLADAASAAVAASSGLGGRLVLGVEALLALLDPGDLLSRARRSSLRGLVHRDARPRRAPRAAGRSRPRSASTRLRRAATWPGQAGEALAAVGGGACSGAPALRSASAAPPRRRCRCGDRGLERRAGQLDLGEPARPPRPRPARPGPRGRPGRGPGRARARPVRPSRRQPLGGQRRGAAQPLAQRGQRGTRCRAASDSARRRAGAARLERGQLLAGLAPAPPRPRRGAPRSAVSSASSCSSVAVSCGQVVGEQAGPRVAQVGLDRLRAAGDLGLPAERAELAADLGGEVGEAGEVGLHRVELAERLLLALAVLEDARRLLDEAAPLLGRGAQHGVELALPDDDVHLAADARSR